MAGISCRQFFAGAVASHFTLVGVLYIDRDVRFDVIFLAADLIDVLFFVDGLIHNELWSLRQRYLL